MVYVDMLVIIDLLFNYVILLTVGVLLNRIVHFKNMFLAAVVGTINVIFLFIELSPLGLFLSSWMFALVMSLIGFKYKDFIYTGKNVVYMYFSGIFYAGFVYLINTNIFPEVDSMLLYLIILLLMIPIVTIIYIKSIKNITNTHSKYYYVDVYLYNQEKFRVVAFLDTGNKLVEPYGLRPIILLKKSLVREVEKKILVPYNTVDNHNLLECIIPEKIYIEKIGMKKKVAIGLVNEVNIEGIDCILNESLL